ncbi:hypothetical protein TKK_0000531 [Trichogramma kaykai]|uniref:Uncharacterized protein n=1 Tax=Trichogramma kaykai TaxID=54128 RepID=A0ABD2WLE8_9HYME
MKPSEKNIKKLERDVSKLIENKLFVGTFKERRYVESLSTYRDIVVIESTDDLVPNMLKAKSAFEKFTNSQWIGITTDSNTDDCLLWVELPSIPLGKHWFQIKGVTFESKEILLELTHVQPFINPDRSFNTTSDPDFPTFDIKEILTYKNFCEAVKFMAIVIMTLFTLTIEIMRYLGEWSIKFSHVVVNLIHVSTPICLGAFEFLSKCVGGLYWLIFVLVRGGPNTPAVPAALMASNKPKQIGYYDPNQRKRYEPLYPNKFKSYTPGNQNYSYEKKSYH